MDYAREGLQCGTHIAVPGSIDRQVIIPTRNLAFIKQKSPLGIEYIDPASNARKIRSPLLKSQSELTMKPCFNAATQNLGNKVGNLVGVILDRTIRRFEISEQLRSV